MSLSSCWLFYLRSVAVPMLIATACLVEPALAQDASQGAPAAGTPAADTPAAAAPAAGAAAPAGTPAADTATAAAAAPAEAAPPEPTAPAFSQEQLNQMLAPIALYPDPLLIQLCMASTYPLEIVEADRWRKKNSALEGAALDTALEAEDWDPSVKAMAIFPDILTRMSENLDWTQDLGDAFLSQQAQVLDTVQSLRKEAYDAGNLKTSEQQNVTVEEGSSSQPTVIQIEPAQPQTVYVPQYNSSAVYGTPPPTTSYYPEVNTGYSGTEMLMAGAVGFGAGMLVGNLIWDDDSDCDWDDHDVYYGGGGGDDVDIDVNGDVNIGNEVNVGNRVGGGDRNRQTWKHNPAHRGGVQYRDTKTRQQFANQAGARPALDRGAARGYNNQTLGSGGGVGTAGAGRGGVGTSGVGRGGVGTAGTGRGGVAAGAAANRAGTGGAGAGAAGRKAGSGVGAQVPSAKTSAGSRAAASSKGSAGSRAATSSKGSVGTAQAKRSTSGIGSAGGNRPTAVGGLGGGAATRAASSRGALSRGGLGGGGGRSSGGGGRSGGGGGRGGGGGGGGRRR